ncbi:MAG: TatD family hydrolase [Chloroflexota bacterium]
MHRLVDTHAHLDEITGLDGVLAEARSAGVIAVIAVGSDYQSNQEVLRLAWAHPGFVYPALGWHPWRLKASEIDLNLEYIAANIDQAVAVGEVGLDYHKRVRAVAEKDLQQGVLRELLKIAREHAKPVLVHSRYAWRDAFSLVDESQVAKALFHWYTGTSSVLRDIVSRGYFLSATPAVEYHEEHRRAVKEAPLDRLVLETDSPVVYRRGSELEYQAGPSDVIRSLKGAADLHGVSEASAAEATTANALRFFGLNI